MITRLIHHFSITNRVKTRSGKRQSYNYPRCLTHVPGDYIAQAPVSYKQKIQQLSPYQKYLIQTRSLERPFTGQLNDDMSTGFYHCAICSTRLFTFNHKYISHTGYATFWTSINQRIRIVEEQVKIQDVNKMKAQWKSHNDKHKRIQCSHCSTHLGALFFDGPPPTFLRYTVNSALLKFIDMPDFENPHIQRKDKIRQMQNSKIHYIK